MRVIHQQQNKIADLEQENKELKQQLAEKDKEIKKHISALEYNENNLPNQKKAIRHQVCEEIKEKIKQLIENKDFSLCNFEYGYGLCYGLQYDMAAILEQIEKGTNEDE